MDKVIRSGKVAVLYSPGFGAGWYTWNDKKMLWLIFHPELIDLVEQEKLVEAAELAEKIGAELYGQEEYVCTLGSRDLQIAWIDEDTLFRINEYDGSESIEFMSDESFIKA